MLTYYPGCNGVLNVYYNADKVSYHAQPKGEKRTGRVDGHHKHPQLLSSENRIAAYSGGLEHLVGWACRLLPSRARKDREG